LSTVRKYSGVLDLGAFAGSGAYLEFSHLNWGKLGQTVKDLAIHKKSVKVSSNKRFGGAVNSLEATEIYPPSTQYYFIQIAKKNHSGFDK